MYGLNNDSVRVAIATMDVFVINVTPQLENSANFNILDREGCLMKNVNISDDTGAVL